MLACLRGQTELEDDVRAYGRGKSGLVERHFVLSLVQTAEGLPIAHEVHAGNTAEAKTLLPMVRGLLARYPLKRVALVADRGLAQCGQYRSACQAADAQSMQSRDWRFGIDSKAPDSNPTDLDAIPKFRQ